MKKKLYVLTAIICSLWSFGQNFTAGGINYTVTSATSPFRVRVGINTSFVGAATIPATVTNGGTTYAVTSIGSQAFQGCTGLTSVTLPNSITSLGILAFYECSNLTSINLPNAITSIGDQAFQSCTSLTSVTIPNAMTSIRPATFLFCTGLTTVNLPDSVTSIGNSAFRGCTNLDSINIPTALTIIDVQAFQETALTSVIIPNSVTTIGSSSFQLCNNLNSFVFGNSVTSVGSSTFFACPNLTSVTLSNSITTIGDYSFYACSNLDSITFPNSVTTIGSNAFGQCYSISSITLPNSITTIGVSAFNQCFNLTSVTLPSSITSIGDNAFRFCSALNSFTVNWTTPIVITASVFQNVTQSNVTLNVPLGTRATYQAAPVWQNFTIPCPPTAVPTAIATQVYAGSGTLANLVVNGTSIKWYTAATNGSLLPDTTSLVNGTTYYASQTIFECESASRVAVTVRKISEASQSFCGTTIVSNLVTTPSSGTTASWYTTASGGTAVTPSTALVTGTYYVEQVAPLSIETVGSGFSLPSGIALQADGKILVADSFNNAVKRMNADGSAIVTLGSGFSRPWGVAVQADGKIVIADYENSAVKRMNADGTGIEILGSGFNTPRSVAVQSDGKIVVADFGNAAIKRMNADGTGIVTLGGSFVNPGGVAIQADGKIVVAETFNNAIKRMNADGTGIETLGSGFNRPWGVTVQADGKILVADTNNNAVKRMNADGTGIVTIGSGFLQPFGFAIQPDGKILVANFAGNTIRRITEATTSNRVAVQVTVQVTPQPTAIATQVYVGSGTLANLTVTGATIKWYTAATNGSLLPDTTSLVNGTTYYASQTIAGCESATRVAVTVRRISEASQAFCSPATVANLVATPSAATTASWYAAATGGAALTPSTALATGTYYIEQSAPSTVVTLGSGFSGPSDVAVQADGKILVASTFNNTVRRMESNGSGIVILGSGFSSPRGVVVQPDGKIIVADASNNAIKRMNADGTGIEILGSGFNSPKRVALQSDGKIIIADGGNNAIKRMNSDGTGIVTLGSGFSGPWGVAVQADGKILIADTSNNAIKRMNADGTGIVTLGGGFNLPFSVAVQTDGKILVADYQNNAIKRMNADGTGIETVANSFSGTIGVTQEANGAILVADFNNSAIKRITLPSASNRVAVTITVTPSTENTTVITACDSYTWSNNGQTYTTSGVYNGSTTNCVTEVLNLTINNSSTTSETITACDSYTWLENGTTYTTSGIYTNTTTNASGCPNVATLNLTINNSTTDNSLTVSAINTYTWDAPLGSGLTYTTSGVYTHTTTNAAGCTNVATLTLTITPIVNSFVIGSSCGSIVSSLAVTIITPLVSGVSSYMFRVTNVATSDSFVVTRPVNSFALSNYPGVLLGAQYQVEVSTNGGATYGSPCIVFTPAPISTIGAQCGTTLASMNQFVYATFVSSVTGYRFRVTNLTTNAVEVYDALSGQNRFTFNQLSAAIRANSTTYAVEVALRNTDGSYLPYGTACTISTPAFPTSEIILSQCDTVATSTAQTFNAVVVSGATAYRFQLTNATLSYSFSVDRPLSNYSLSMFTGLVPGTTYTVRVAVRIGGVWGPLTGKPCNVTTPGIAPGGERTIIKSNDFAVITYPNPFTESFMFDVKTTNESTIQVRVYDMVGKQIENRTVETSEMNTIQIGSSYPSGVYNVIVSQGENTQTLRVIKR